MVIVPLPVWNRNQGSVAEKTAGLEKAGGMFEAARLTAEAEIGKIYRGKVVGIKEFGAFVEILPEKDGLLHISEIADRRIQRVEDVLKLGDEVWVKVLDIDERGKIRLSRKQAMAERDAEAKRS